MPYLLCNPPETVRLFRLCPVLLQLKKIRFQVAQIALLAISILLKKFHLKTFVKHVYKVLTSVYESRGSCIVREIPVVKAVMNKKKQMHTF